MTLRLELPDRGVLFVVSGPSGVGKSTLVRAAIERVPGLSFSVSATTRAPRPGERDGVDYHFIPADRFEQWVVADAFLEHAQVYGRRYGTLREPTDQALARGASLLLDIDVQGAAQVRLRMPESVHIYLLPPVYEALEARLKARGTESEAVVRQRMRLADEQLRASPNYDYVVVNDDLEAAHAAFQGILVAETCRRSRRQRALDRVLAALPDGPTTDPGG